MTKNTVRMMKDKLALRIDHIIIIAALAVLTIAPAIAANDPAIIDNMDSTTNWNTFADGIGSTIVLNSALGVNNRAVEMSFDLKANGWVGIARNIDPAILSGTNGIKFSYKGSGALNRLELKLIDIDGTNFGVLWDGASVADDWVPMNVPYTNFQCLWCNTDRTLDLSKINKIEIAVSNQAGRSPGAGTVVIDEIQGFTT